MKKILLPLFLAGALSVRAQDVKEWLQLPPVAVQQPAFSQMQNVENRTFDPSMMMKHNGLDIRDLMPAEGEKADGLRNLVWRKAQMEGDTLTVPALDRTSLQYFAVYFTNSEWISGRFTMNLFGCNEVYIDGRKVASSEGKGRTLRQIPGEWLPGKHTVIIKSLGRGGRIASLSFQADEAFKEAGTGFSLSPVHGKTIREILDSRAVSSVSLSSSGRHAMVTLRSMKDGVRNTATEVYRTADRSLLYTFAGKGDRALQWIPGTERISFMQEEGKGMSLCSYDVETGSREVLIRNAGAVRNYSWAPDRSYLVYYKSENYGDPQWKLRKLDGIEDRQDYFRRRSFLCKYDFTTGMHSRLTWGNLSTSLMDISPDGSRLLVSTTRPTYEEYPFSSQNVYLINARTLETDTVFSNLKYSIGCSFSPDGRKLLAQGGASAFGKEGEKIGRNRIPNQYDTQLYIYDLDSRQVEYLTRDFDPSVDEAVWHSDGRIYAKVSEADFVRLYRYDKGRWSRLDCPGETVRSFALADQGRTMLYTAVSHDMPLRIYRMDTDNDEAGLWNEPCRDDFRHVALAEMKDWDYTYRKGTVIDGRYYLPAGFDPKKKYPMIVYYYGGTTPVTRGFGGRWPFNLYTAHGYVVYVLQPSGTIGYGQEFSARHQNNWGRITGDEIIAATKAFLKAHPFVDPERVGCMGASYGGFTTEYLTTQTDLFACAISHAGISSIAGYWGEGYWGYGYSANASAHSYPWNNRDLYVGQSPLFNADKVQTPILLIHGTADVNVPTGQSIEFYTALKLLGKDAELVFVKDADHHVVDYEQRILWNNTILAYFAKYLQGRPAWWEHQYRDLNL